VQDSHLKLIREIGAASTVLLKNVKKALPLKLNRHKRIGISGRVAGPNLNGPDSGGSRSRACGQCSFATSWGSDTASKWLLSFVG
jgi:beta-glucosidase-like glycosyl hydrolase